MTRPPSYEARLFTRRDALLGAGAAIATWRVTRGVTPVSKTAADVHDLTALSAHDLSVAIHARRVSCVQVMQAYLAKIERCNAAVNAIVSLQPAEELLRQAAQRDAELEANHSLGWMHGLPHAVKDLALTKGIRTSFGSPLFDSVPDQDDIFVERIRASGAILIGKTNAPELGFGSQTYNTVFGTTRNAYDQAKCAGGSSGGAAVSLALRMVPVADGSDNMGSLRNPAAFNNVYGFRPSWGRVPSGHGDLFMNSLPTDGPMARSVQDLSLLLSTMAGADPRDPFSIQQDPAVFSRDLSREFRGTRIAWLGDYHGYLATEPGVLELCQQAHDTFRTIGCQVELTQFDFDPAELWKAYVTLRQAAAAASLGADYRDPERRKLLKPEIQWEIEGGLNVPASEVLHAAGVRSNWYRAVQRLFSSYDFALLPSAQVFPFDAGVHWPRAIAGRTMDTYHRWMEVAVPATMGALPALNVPVGFSRAGLPMGMQILGPRNQDIGVLQLGHAYDLKQSWTRTLPPLLGVHG
ncbi:MAG: amidase [Proteobacteria bacterium]|nr:amidase [Pseudomonadota bacterium]